MPETEPVLTNEQHDLINEWVFDMCEEYDLPLTNNEPRAQNGVQLRHIGEFTGDLMDLVKGIKAAARREALLKAKRTMCAECASRVDEEEER